MKLLSPYIENTERECGAWFFRHYIGTEIKFAVYSYSDLDKLHWGEANRIWARVFDPNTSYSSKQNAMDALDKDLINRGFTLLTEEQYEKLKTLL
jgi:hypothetical protein